MNRKYPENSTCSEGCDKPVQCKGMCESCYRKDYRDRRASGEDTTRQSKGDHCLTDGCTREVFCRSMCNKCYAVAQRATYDPAEIKAQKKAYRELKKAEIKAQRKEYRQRERAKLYEYNRAYVAAHPEQIREMKRKSNEKNPQPSRDRAKKWYKDNPEAVRKQHLAKYGLTEDQWIDMWEGQGGKCAICPVMMIPGGQSSASVAIDHCHITNKVRQLICCKCNKGMGHFSDDPDQMQSATDYLRRHRDRINAELEQEALDKEHALIKS